MKKYLISIFLVTFLNLGILHAEGEPSAKLLKYHKALQTRPLNQQLFERFYDTWLEEMGQKSLEGFLKSGDSKTWQHWALLARCEMRRGNSDRAIVSLDKALKLEPKHSELLFLRAKLSVRDLKFDEAISFLESCGRRL